MSTTKVLEGPDGMLYEIPADVLAKYVVPGPKVAELRARLGAKATATAPSPASPASAAPAAAAPLPPGHHRMPPPGASAAPAVINIYVGAGAPPSVQVHQAGQQASGGGIEGYHLAVDEHGIPHHHVEMLWGDYIDRQGKPAVGYHSHDPVTGNAQ
jgi:hypothetical protein